MKRSMKLGPAGVNLGLIITPMLDMSFQILAFFIMTYHPSALEGYLSGARAANVKSGGTVQDPNPDNVVLGDDDLAETITVIVRTGGAMPGKPDKLLVKRPADAVAQQIADANNTWEHAKRELERELKQYRKDAGTEATNLRIEADGKLRQQFVIDVYDVCKNAGFAKIHFVPPPRTGEK
jgi:biopolymer transport protein ExbD